MIRKFLVGGAVIFLGMLLYIAWPSPVSTDRLATVTDLSWPNCKITSGLGSSSGIIGVTGGLDFHPNRCLYSETKLFNTYALYMNTGYPGPDSRARKFADSPRACGPTNTLCLAYNYGFNAAVYAITYANLQAVHASQWWLDVETSNSWTNNVLQNRAVLSGMAAAIRQHTFLPTVGIYSYPGQWDSITGHWRNGFPAWAATGAASRQAAISACKAKSFTGGAIRLAQYTTKLDHNYVCHSDYPLYVQL